MSVQAYLRRTWRQLPFTDKDPFDVRINDSLDELSIQIDLLKAELKHIKQDYEAIDEESLPETDQKRRLVYQKFSDKKHTAEEEILNLVTFTYVKNLIFNVDSTSQSNSISMSSLICDDNEIHEEIIEKVRA